MQKDCVRIKNNLIELRKLVQDFFSLYDDKDKAGLDKLIKRKNQIEEMMKEIKKEIGQEIIAITPEGKEVKIKVQEQLKQWKKLYADNGIDWIDLPESIELTEEQAQEIRRLIELGLDTMMIIPENIVNTGERYEKLHQKMSKGYKKTDQADNFKNDGGFEGIKDKQSGLRIVMVKNIQELEEDDLHKETLDKSLDDLEAEDGIFKKNKVRGLSPSEYLIFQRKYFNETGKYLDSVGWTWLPEVKRSASGCVPSADWDPVRTQLDFRSDTADDRDGYLGCRLAGSVDIQS